jgi:hypothetical protein
MRAATVGRGWINITGVGVAMDILCIIMFKYVSVGGQFPFYILALH